MPKSSLIQRIKAKLHAFMFWQSGMGDFLNKMYDLRIFYRYSFRISRLRNQDNERALLTKQYHIVEKGLALPFPRPGFGEKKITDLIGWSNRYIDQYGEDDLVASIKSCLREYLDFNALQNTELSEAFKTLVTSFVGDHPNTEVGGTKLITRESLRAHTDIPFEAFVKSRFSVRNFADSDVPIDSLEKAVEMARHAPSVCNRQSWKVHVYQNKEQRLKLLKLQGGNNGFSESINTLLIVTTNTKAFTAMESNQVYVDGGIFSMNLVLSLHALEIGSCCLNTCFPYTIEKKVKKIGDIPENERLIMMMGTGRLKDTYKVARSRKKDTDELMVVH